MMMQIEPQVRRITADNPGPMTHTGTQTYLVGGPAEQVLIDPGPDLHSHRAALLDATQGGGMIARILVTHAHIDHTPLATRLGRELGIPVCAFGAAGAGRSPQMQALAASGADLGGGEGIDASFTPDQCIADGQIIRVGDIALRAIHTPGHTSDHLCFALEGTGLLFSGDHVMGWSTTLVSPPDGDLTAFMASLDKVRGQGFTRFLPGHGDPVEAPDAEITRQIAHRRGREAQILEALEGGERKIAEIVPIIYAQVNPALHPAAARNVLAHMLDLVGRDLVQTDMPLRADGVFRLA